MNNAMKPVTIPATPDHCRAPDGIPFVPCDPEAVDQVRAAIKRHRERQNREDENRRTRR